jgi:hypothetical protein
LWLTIHNNGVTYKPIVQEGIVWDTQRQGVPGKLTFTVVKDNIIDFQEGNLVRLTNGDSNIFYGYVFTKKRDKNQNITVTAYDQLRYLKNKDTLRYENMTAGELIKLIAEKFQLKIGDIADTEYIIKKKLEDNITLFDMIQNALDVTLQNKKKMYVLYDDFGKLVLRNFDNMQVDFFICSDNAQDYDYTSSIDSQTYNKIRLAYDNKQTGKKDIYEVHHSTNMKTWGTLQYFEKLQQDTNAKVKADTLLELYNRKTRNLMVSNILGDDRVRAGSFVKVYLELGDVTVQSDMLVEKAKHSYKNDEHLMDLTLRGGEFDA